MSRWDELIQERDALIVQADSLLDDFLRMRRERDEARAEVERLKREQAGGVS